MTDKVYHFYNHLANKSTKNDQYDKKEKKNEIPSSVAGQISLFSRMFPNLLLPLDVHNCACVGIFADIVTFVKYI